MGKTEKIQFLIQNKIWQHYFFQYIYSIQSLSVGKSLAQFRAHGSQLPINWFSLFGVRRIGVKGFYDKNIRYNSCLCHIRSMVLWNGKSTDILEICSRNWNTNWWSMHNGRLRNSKKVIIHLARHHLRVVAIFLLFKISKTRKNEDIRRENRSHSSPLRGHRSESYELYGERGSEIWTRRSKLFRVFG